MTSSGWIRVEESFKLAVSSKPQGFMRLRSPPEFAEKEASDEAGSDNKAVPTQVSRVPE